VAQAAALRRKVGARRADPRFRPFLGAATAFVAAVAALAHVTEDYLTKDPLVRWDVDFATWLHAHTSPTLVTLFRVVTLAGSVAVLAALTAVAVFLLVRAGRRRDAVWLGCSAAAVELLNGGLKLLFHRPRPELGFVHLDTYSFPSGHATGATAIYALYAVLLASTVRVPRAALVAGYLALVVAVGFSRLYLGAHYLSDVLAGTALGAACAALAMLVRLAGSPR
jgi:membrane-associated phospholipid phosphatase